MRAHLMRWPLDADKEVSILFKSDLGNVDLLRTMPLPDFAANAGTHVPKTSLDHEGRSLRANSLQKIISGTEMKIRNPKVNQYSFLDNLIGEGQV